ncbi:hypothetical protein MKK69_24385 [Methylobacterium sp. J-026]|uniref:hypothetical protein n=1 Tax=Methylobacterium sp. J-026 TaxID=2836624 RepID=UPI001FBA4CF0|nr:hypothetical protein [Methylobacterium sp. J-026]MCJ2137141.1 hypothetical protein [Methylobacterium sp. J-026]
MYADQTIRCRFEGEMTSLVARMQSYGDARDRYALFDALRDLEDRAVAGGAPVLTLRKIAEVRFLVGILREAVRPFPAASLRTVLRACGPRGASGGAAAVAVGGI